MKSTKQQLYMPTEDERIDINEFIVDMEWDEDYSYKRDRKKAAALRAAPFKLVTISLKSLERAKARKLKLEWLMKENAGQSMTPGPVILDKDYSVIDGMHRIATAYFGGQDTIEAYVSTR